MTVYRAVWPILDDAYRRSELIEQAEPELHRMAFRSGVVLLARPRWTLRGLTLIAECPAEPLIRPLRPCGSHAAHARHVARGETPCPVCVLGERAYQRARKRTKRGKVVAA